MQKAEGEAGDGDEAEAVAVAVAVPHTHIIYSNDNAKIYPEVRILLPLPG